MTDWLEIGNCRIACGDCLQILPELEAGSIDAAVTDPPYGVEGGHGGQLRDYKKADYDGDWTDNNDYVRSVCVPAIEHCRRICKAVALTPGTRCCFSYSQADDMGCFWCPAAPRKGKWGFTTFQPILYYGWNYLAGKGQMPTGRTLVEVAQPNGHPCPKPIKAWTWLVEKTCPPSGTVLDPFMGSGTTGVACIKTGRRFVGIEIEKKYFDIAEKRIRNAWENRQGKLF